MPYILYLNFNVYFNRAIRDGSKDEAYWEKRKRNNDAAKRSREKRRVNDMVCFLSKIFKQMQIKK